MEASLTCPITQELLSDPVVVPCCTKAFSRVALIQALYNKRECPMCRGNLDMFDASTAPKNRVLAELVEQLRNEPRPLQHAKGNVWTAALHPVEGNLVQLVVELRNSQFVTNPSVFIAVVDKSGSMSGSPWRQVKSSLVHIAGLTETNPMLQLVIISYESVAKREATSVEAIRAFPEASGGTNFLAAFKAVKEVLMEQRDTNVGSATIAFLTDGQSGGDRKQLIQQFKECLQDSWPANKALSCHAIGFGQACDKELLEGLRTENGTFRYAEPGENDDALCNKLTSLFEVAAMSSMVSIHLASASLEFMSPAAGEFSIPVGRNGTGELCVFARKRGDEPIVEVLLTSSLDKDVRLVPRMSSVSRLPAWCAHVVDTIATELFQLSKSSSDPLIRELHLGLLDRKLVALEVAVSGDPVVAERVSFLRTSVDQLMRGRTVNVGKLGDLRFGSKFGGGAAGGSQKKVEPIVAAIAPDAVPQISDKAKFKERAVPRYNRNVNASRERNELMCSIVENLRSHMSSKTKELIDKATDEELNHVDLDGNTPLLLASYCGQYQTVSCLLGKGKTIDINACNKAGETALTLAIKKRGFHKTMNILLEAGCALGDRTKGLEEFALDQKFTLTATILASLGSNAGDIARVDATMTEEYIKFVYGRLVDGKKPVDYQMFFQTACAKCMVDFCEKLLAAAPGNAIMVTVEMLLCSVPPKPDHPDTEKYLGLTKLLLAHGRPGLINEKSAADGIPPLFHASDQGSLPHVKFFLDSGADIEGTNPLLNTALWIACAKRFPCIVSELIQLGANVNALNDKGNPPLYSVMQKGPLKILEEMVANGASLENINQNGDTFILLACRNGQPEILEFLLQYTPPELVRFRAKIDGFDAVFASVEGNRPECLKVLSNYDATLLADNWTDLNNEIIAGATPLHLAAYYGRIEAAKMLLSLGADANARDKVNQQTPLHVAVIQAQPAIVTLLKSKTDLSLRDKAGQTAASYARSDELLNVLFDRVSVVLSRLAVGGFSKDLERTAVELLEKASSVPGILYPWEALDIPLGTDGVSCLALAVKYQNYPVAKTLVDLGCNCNSVSQAGVPLRVIAGVIGNPRVAQLLGKPTEEEVAAIARIKSLAVGPNAKVLFLGKPPSVPSVQKASSIKTRMDLSAAAVAPPAPNGGDDPAEEASVFEAKLKVIELLASHTSDMPPKEMFALCLYANSASLAAQLKGAMISFSERQELPPRSNDVLLDFTRGLLKLPPFESECYVAASSVERPSFSVGNVVSFPFFFSATSLWRVATEQLPDFATKKREGVVFIIKPLGSARHLSAFSQSNADAEVAFLPFAKFRVAELYHGDPICLGQPNIRAHTFRLKSAVDHTKWDGVVAGKNHSHMMLEEMMAPNCKKSLIIELHELPRSEELKFLK